MCLCSFCDRLFVSFIVFANRIKHQLYRYSTLCCFITIQCLCGCWLWICRNTFSQRDEKRNKTNTTKQLIKCVYPQCSHMFWRQTEFSANKKQSETKNCFEPVESNWSDFEHMHACTNTSTARACVFVSKYSNQNYTTKNVSFHFHSILLK